MNTPASPVRQSATPTRITTDVLLVGAGVMSATLGSLLKTLQQAKVGTMAIDVWIDRDNLLRKSVQKFSTAQGPSTVTMVVNAYDVPVDVTAPPKSEVADLAQLSQQGGLVG